MSNLYPDGKWDVIYITSQGTYVDHNTREPRDQPDIRKDPRTKTAWVGERENRNNPASCRSLNFEVGD